MRNTARLTNAQLTEPAAIAVRRVALARIDAVTVAYRSFRASDPEGLHDLRVALRRLRSWLRAFRPQFDDTLRRKARKRLTALARATGAARDAEVAVAWLAALGPLRGPAAISAQQGVVDESTAARRAAARVLGRELPRVLAALRAQLSLTAASSRVTVGARARPAAPVIAAVVRGEAAFLERALARADSLSRTTELHRARIEGKRLRYLLEPLGRRRGIADIDRALTSMQDVLGAMRDAHVLSGRFATTRSLAAAAKRAERSEFARFRRAWRPRASALLLRRVASVCRDLDAMDAESTA